MVQDPDRSGTVCRKGRYGGIHPGTMPGNQLQESRYWLHRKGTKTTAYSERDVFKDFHRLVTIYYLPESVEHLWQEFGDVPMASHIGKKLHMFLCHPEIRTGEVRCRRPGSGSRTQLSAPAVPARHAYSRHSYRSPSGSVCRYPGRLHPDSRSGRWCFHFLQGTAIFR